MAIKTGLGRGEHADINVTPLIDVLLVLLIICMVVQVPKSVGHEADIPQPANGAPARVQETAVVISIDDQLALHINQEEVNLDALAGRLKQIFSARGDRTAFIKATPDTEFQHVAQVIDMARASGVDHIGLLR
jgi:biopolymer transport protein ExbD